MACIDDAFRRETRRLESEDHAEKTADAARDEVDHAHIGVGAVADHALGGCGGAARSQTLVVGNEQLPVRSVVGDGG